MRSFGWAICVLLAPISGCYFDVGAPANPLLDGGPDAPPDGAPDGSPDGSPDGGPDDDMDGDAIVDSQDNCPGHANPDQRDFDQDGIGDACDTCPHVKNEGPLDDPDGDLIDASCDPEAAQANVLLWFQGGDEALSLPWVNVDEAWSIDGHRITNGQASPAFAWRPPAAAWLFVEAQGRIEAFGEATAYGGVAAMVGDGASEYVQCGVAQAPGQPWSLVAVIPSTLSDHVAASEVSLDEDQPFVLRLRSAYEEPALGGARTLAAQCDLYQAQLPDPLDVSVVPSSDLSALPNGGAGIEAENATLKLRYVVAYGRAP